MIPPTYTDPSNHAIEVTDPQEALLRAAALRLVGATAPFRVLSRDRVVALSGATDWRSVRFDEALTWAVENDVLRHLGADMYEIPLHHEGS